MNRFEAIPNRSWRNTKNGRTASLYGAHPATSAGDLQNWTVVQNGWTIKDTLENRVGGFQACPPGSSEEHAKEVAANLNKLFPARIH